jgi:tetratricopeptide (TPR) repeat protein
MKAIQYLMMLLCVSLIISGCAKKGDEGKISITTSSDEAKKEFLLGRDLAERLLLTNAREHFDKAIALDPNFATAYLNRANVSFTGTEFFTNLKKAVALSDKSSEGERLLILANESAANGNTAKQKEYAVKLVVLFPRDERALYNLGGYYYAVQEYTQAIEQYKKAIEIDTNYSPSYNILGYAYRQVENYPDAEKAFKKYIELVPNDPNPYDSYAELLMKMGRFDESIVNYRKALSLDSNFVSSRAGIAADFLFKGLPDTASIEAEKIQAMARNDGDVRTSFFTRMVIYADEGKMDLALKEAEMQYALGEKIDDVAAMSADLQSKGTILLEMKKFDEALQAFEKSVQIVAASDLSPEIKDNAQLTHHYNLALMAIGKKDLNRAKAEAAEFSKGADANNSVNLKWRAHQLAGSIALMEKKNDAAIAELLKANQQNPYDLFRLALAYKANGDNTNAKEFCMKAAHFYGLPGLNYAFIRSKAEKMLAAM